MSFEQMRFQATWREYQERVLTNLDSHLDDDSLHIVAAPGSGKTVLGLEVMRRIGKPAVILAPTITIRNQWIDRLVSMFLPGGTKAPDWISKDIRSPGYLTVITYQALHAAYANAEEEPGSLPAVSVNFVEALQRQGVEVLVLDEAHHLRREWWRALTRLKSELENPKVIALTASPPYDTDRNEWEKYEQLCGPIDEEISVPELVKRGDLCPHQDYIYFSLPTDREGDRIVQFRNAITEFTNRLIVNQPLIEAMQSHPWIRAPQDYEEQILGEPLFFSTLVVFLRAVGRNPSQQALNILGVKYAEIPELDLEWLESFLTHVLCTRSHDFPAIESLLAALRGELKALGAIE
ncbi:DEAD/DEAH box helicase [Roseibium sp.]|uniref:DEAD/DEAH box helicase n=1 Tax=Roseibium sp. TaxID=1936156 RepID=UPI003B50F79B